MSAARSARYPSPGYVVRIGDLVWASALETVRGYARLGTERGQLGSEALVYLGGVVAGAEVMVTGLYRMHHHPQGDRVVATPDEARWLVRMLRERDEKLIAQLHSHRGLAGHSFGDDAWATSFHDGFLSIIVPRFGAAVAAPIDCAVLEYRDGRFVELPPDEIARRLRIEPEIVERRPVPAAPHEKQKPWSEFVQRLKSIALKRR